MIVDNTQAFFSKPVDGIDTFYSCRKFFGVPDGAYLYTKTEFDAEIEQDCSYSRLDSLTKRIDISPKEGYGDFKALSNHLAHNPIKKMSRLTQRMMHGIGYGPVAKQRMQNYYRLHQALSESNNLNIPLPEDAVPMIYPYMQVSDGTREYLISKNVFVARYWPNVLQWADRDSDDYYLTLNILPLPIDQRYGQEEMDYIINLIIHYNMISKGTNINTSPRLSGGVNLVVVSFVSIGLQLKN